MRFPSFAFLIACTAIAQLLSVAQKPFTIADALSAPFMNQLTAAPAKNRIAWFVDDEGKRNVWAASPTEKAHSLTHYTHDDGQDIDEITWSPDATRVAYTHGTGPEGTEHPVAANPAQLQQNIQQRVEIATWNGDVHILDTGHSAVFSTDGKRLFYLREGKIYAANTDTNDKPTQLVIAEGNATQLTPSPDGTRLAFVSQRGDHNFIGVFTLTNNTLTYIDPGTGLDHDPAWSADSKQIAFIRESPIPHPLDLRWMRSVPVPWSIRLADASTGKGQQIWQADKGTGSLFHEMAAKNQLLWMNDGRIVFAWEKTGWLHLYSLKPGDTQAKLLTPGNFEVDNVVANGNRIVYSSNQTTTDPNDIDRRHLWSVLSTDTNPSQQTSGTSLESNPALLTNGTLAYMQGSALTPLQPYLQTPNAHITPLAEANPQRFPGASFVTPTMVTFPAADGLQIHGQWFLPKNTKPNEKLPTIVFFHGGSRRQMLLGYNPMQYYAQAYALNQYLVSRGYAVLSVNYRSGTGYGMEFRQAPHYGIFGGTEYMDTEGAVHWLKSQPIVNTKRIGAWGGSYGGYMTALALARDSADFAAGVDLHGVHDWSYEMDAWKLTSDPHYDAAAAAKIAFAASPLADVDQWKSPVLLIQGDDDRNVLFGQTVRLAAELKARNIDVEELIFPDEVHDFLLHKSWIAAYEAAANFFDRKLKSK